MKIDPRIFREYDVRGVAGTYFDPKVVAEYEKWYGKFTGISIDLPVAEAIGKAYGSYVKRQGGKKVVVGFEKRPFAEELTGAFIKGVVSTGIEVSYLGIALTSIVYFATAYYDFDGGVNITGSHNVYFFNGFKMMLKGVAPLYGQELLKLKEMVEEEDFESGQGKVVEKEVWEDYLGYIAEHVFKEGKLKVVVDCGNGSAGLFAPKLLRELNCEVVELFTQPDATFPNHVPDPEMPQNMKWLMDKVKEEKADLGMAFDADGDRVGFVDEKGEMVNADILLLALSRDVLSRNRGKKILFDVKCTELLNKLVPTWGGVPLMHATGHAPIKATLRKDSEVILGGEISGHFYFVENYFRIDDGLFGAARVLEMYRRSGKEKFSDLFSEFPKLIITPEIKLPCVDEKKFAVVVAVVKAVKDKYRSVTIDGIRFYLDDDTWALVRASNTSPYLTIRAEGKTEEAVIKIKNILAGILDGFPEIGDKLNRTQVASLTGRLGWL